MTDPSTSQARNGAPAAGGLVPRGEATAQRCTAHTSSGAPCKRWAIVGGMVCPTHGGSAPQVRAAANRRLMSLVPKAIETLVRVMDDEDAGAPSQVRAAIDLLDRTIGKAVDLTLDLTPEEHGNEALDARISAALERLRPAVGGQDGDVVDAVLVDPETGADLGEDTSAQG